MDKRKVMASYANASSIMQKVLQTLDMSVVDFSNACGVSYNRISDIVRGRTKKLTTVLINIICEAFPQIEKNFLYTGEGEVLVEGYLSKTQLKCSPNATVDLQVNELMKLQQGLLNMQTKIINKMNELNQKEAELIKREEQVKYRELKVIEKENMLLSKGKSA
jgi:hypothetical protein|nr:MAG TPA: protein-turn-helix DNA binding protein [Caudoviricetes sp.]